MFNFCHYLEIKLIFPLPLWDYFTLTLQIALHLFISNSNISFGWVMPNNEIYNNSLTNRLYRLFVVSIYAKIHAKQNTNICVNSLFPQVSVASSPLCGFPLEPITRGAWCLSDSPFILAGWALHSVCWVAVWSPVVQPTPLLHTLTTIDCTTPNRAPPIKALSPLTTPRAHTCERWEYFSRPDLMQFRPAHSIFALFPFTFVFHPCLYLQWWHCGLLSYSWTPGLWLGSSVTYRYMGQALVKDLLLFEDQYWRTYFHVFYWFNTI